MEATVDQQYNHLLLQLKEWIIEKEREAKKGEDESNSE